MFGFEFMGVNRSGSLINGSRMHDSDPEPSALAVRTRLRTATRINC